MLLGHFIFGCDAVLMHLMCSVFVVFVVLCVFNSFCVFLIVDTFWIHFTFFVVFGARLILCCFMRCLYSFYVFLLLCFWKVFDSFYVLFYFWSMFDSFSVLLFAFNALLVHFMFSLYLMRCRFVVCVFLFLVRLY